VGYPHSLGRYSASPAPSNRARFFAEELPLAGLDYGHDFGGADVPGRGIDLRVD
jgi:hypothetical protein